MTRKTRAGMMVAGIVGAAVSMAIGLHTGNPYLAIGGSFAAGMAVGLPFLPVRN